ncbi:NUDIX hydrolase [Heyndrickxia oleronia]|uniref:NUDIX hydrolase n=1 Tax=Heyndrickxia oleronia TaxID=38875 RepID=UPI001B220C39|nr:NUDIX domain-containing protein [Heyndrickxia oleronia]GIN37080.1 DNA mismatch repair protein MutT [Heyndrickxia oleronia]
MRHRGSAVLIKDHEVALIKRIKDGCTYYVFPGGGIESSETPEEATMREAYEELGVRITIIDDFGRAYFNGIQYFYLAEIRDGVFGTGKGLEYTDKNRGFYEPIWVDISRLASLDVRPKEMAKKIHQLFN